MSTAVRGHIESMPPRPWMTVLGQLFAAVLIIAPLVAMLVPELKQRSGSTPSKSRPAVPAATSAAASPSLSPFVVKRSDP
jgi:hypothetical protein